MINGNSFGLIMIVVVRISGVDHQLFLFVVLQITEWDKEREEGN